MLKGFNTDINIRGREYHIQTEDWGPDRAFLVSRVFCSGKVVQTVKTPYLDALQSGPVNDREALGIALRKQHHQVIDNLTNVG